MGDNDSYIVVSVNFCTLAPFSFSGFRIRVLIHCLYEFTKGSVSIDVIGWRFDHTPCIKPIKLGQTILHSAVNIFKFCALALLPFSNISPNYPFCILIIFCGISTGKHHYR
jgi:hypothetical protein